MIDAAAMLLVANALFLVAGIGVRRLLGSTHGSGGPSSVALTYLVGVASFGVLAQLLLVVGLSLTRAEAVAVGLVLFAVGLLRRPRPAPRPTSPRLSGRETLLMLIAGALVVALAVRSLYEPLTSWDAWAFWIPKAKSIVLLNGLDSDFFAAPTTANADYPLLLPAVEAADFRFIGHFDTQIIHLQFWLILVGFLGALPALLRDQVRAMLLRSAVVVLASVPSLALHAESAYADVPLAVFVALAGVLGWRWLLLRDRVALSLLVVFAAAAMATKVEGRLFVAALVASLAVLAARDSFRRSAEVLGAGVAAALVGVLPWALWVHVNHVHGAYHADFAGLGRHAGRIAPAAASLLGHGLDPLEWLVVVPASAAALLLAYRSGTDRRTAWLVISSVLTCFGLLVATYWATPYVFEWHLRTSADRVVIAPLLLLAALTPVVLESVLRAAESGRTGAVT